MRIKAYPNSFPAKLASELLESPWNFGTAIRATTVAPQNIRFDLMPIALDQGLSAILAVGRTAFDIKHITGINKMQALARGDISRSR